MTAYTETDASVKIVQRAQAGKSRPVGYLVSEKDAHLIKEMLLWRKGRPLRIFCRLLFASLILSGTIHQQISPLMALALATTLLTSTIGGSLWRK